MTENNLRGRIIAKYHSVKNFATVMGWSNRKTYDIVNGKQEPVAHDIIEMCNALDVNVPEELRLLFFT